MRRGGDISGNSLKKAVEQRCGVAARLLGFIQDGLHYTHRPILNGLAVARQSREPLYGLCSLPWGKPGAEVIYPCIPVV